MEKTLPLFNLLCDPPNDHLLLTHATEKLPMRCPVKNDVFATLQGATNVTDHFFNFVQSTLYNNYTN